ncbi:MAG: ABC transporter ATP-binding protein [Caldilineaceae bacterium]
MAQVLTTLRQTVQNSNGAGPAASPILQVQNVSKRFKAHGEQRSLQQSVINLLGRNRGRAPRNHFWPLRNISFDVFPGESVGLVGHNGSGKSTLLKLITGILEPTEGQIHVNGRLSSLLELGAGFHPDLTGRENIFLNGAIYGLSRKEMHARLPSIIDFAELHDFIDTPVKHYSSGMYVRLGFAVAIHAEPELLLVDEVLAVGDAAFQHKCLDAIQSFRRRGGTLLMVSHDLGSIQNTCNRAIWLEKGEMRSDGRPIDVAMHYLNRVAEGEKKSANTAILPALENGLRWGSGRVQLEAVQLCDGDGAPQTVFKTGNEMQVRIRYCCKERVDPPVIGLSIHHQNGAHICGPNTDFGELTLPVSQTAGEVVYRIPWLSLLPGAYQVTAAVVDRETQEMYDYHDRAYAFRVYPGASREQYGLVTLRGEWGVVEKG